MRIFKANLRAELGLFILLPLFLVPAHAAPQRSTREFSHCEFSPCELPARDTTPPSIVVTGPREGATVPYLPWVGGWVHDDASGSGVARVIVRIQRQTRGRVFYWDGIYWDLARPKFAYDNGDTKVSGGRWVYEAAPTNYISLGGHGAPYFGPTLFAGLYTITATAYDRAGNARSVARRVRVAPDATPPRVRFTVPHRGATGTELPVVRGWVTDRGGSGVAQVALALTTWQPKGGNLHWTGTRWVAYEGDPTSPDNLTQVRERRGVRWHWKGPLPHGKDLPPGTYTFSVTAYDRAGNRNGLTETRMVDATRNFVIKASRSKAP